MTCSELIEHTLDLADLAENEGFTGEAFQLRTIARGWVIVYLAVQQHRADLQTVQSELCDAVDPTLSHRCGLHNGHDGQHAASDADRAIAVATWPRAGSNK